MLYPGVGEQVQDTGHMTEHLPDTLTALDLQTIRTATKLEGTEMQTLIIDDTQWIAGNHKNLHPSKISSYMQG